MGEHETLSDAEALALLRDGTDHIVSFLAEHSLDIDTLKLLYKEENNGGQRQDVLDAIEDQISPGNLADHLGLTQGEQEDCSRILGQLGLQDLIDLEQRAAHIDQELADAVTIIGDSVDGLEDRVKSSNANVHFIDLLLTLEKKTKDRKTAKSFLQKEKERLEREEQITVIKLEQKVASSEKNRREQLIQKLVADGLPEDQLRETTTADLEQLCERRGLLDDETSEQSEGQREEAQQQEEDSEREQLIQKLKDQGLPEEQLRKASTNDLRNILDRKTSDSGKDREQIIREAERDLQNLKRRARLRHQDRMHDAVDKIKKRMFGSKKSDEQPMPSRRDIKQVLASYQGLDDAEAALKTAHIMRGYIQMGVGATNRMTFKEAADTLPDADNPHLQQLKDFLRRVHRAQYADDQDFSDVEQIIKNCRYVIERLHFSEG